jgi:hypothetical protein
MSPPQISKTTAPTSRQVVPLATVAWGLVLAGVACAAPANDAAVVAAQRRQDAARSFAVEYKQTEVIAPGGLYSTVKPIPAEETTIVSTGRVVVDGEKVRFESNHAHYFLPGKPFVEKHEVYLFSASASS